MTASGRRFWPLEPRVEDVWIEDIAHHLSHLCRFIGAVRTFYSVAQHSVLVSRACAPAVDEATLSRNDCARRRQAGLVGLLHDASEAYLMDIPRPLKRDRAFAAYCQAEAQLQGVIYQAFGLGARDTVADLKLIDRRMLRTEQRDLMPPSWPGEQRDDVEPFAFSLVDATWSPAQARMAFLERHVALLVGSEVA